MGKRITKEKSIREFRENAQVIFKIECNICGQETESETDDMALDASEALGKFEKQLWKDGWRYSVSKTYGHVGLHCQECHKNRNKPE
jgi:transcription elongation factor Elf1